MEHSLEAIKQSSTPSAAVPIKKAESFVSF